MVYSTQNYWVFGFCPSSSILKTRDHNLSETGCFHPQARGGELEISLRTTYFQVDDKFLQQKDGMAKGSSLSPIISNIYMEHFEKLDLDSAQHKPLLCLQYVDIFVVWPHGPEWLQNFLSHFNSLRPSIQFTMETESDSAIPFLDVLVIRKETTLATKIHETHQHWLISQLQISQCHT
jgi:hypothetical protein